MYITYDIFAKIDPKDTVDKLNKSNLTGNINVKKMVLSLVSCWWCLLLLLLSRECNNPPSQSVVRAGDSWQRERHRMNSSTSLSQPCLPTNHRAFFANVRWCVTKIGYFGTYIRYLPTNPTLIPCHLIVAHHRYF